MAKFSQKMMGKEVGQAEKYAQPHTMGGKAITPGTPKMVDPNTLDAKQSNKTAAAKRVSLGDPAADNVKTSGIKIRGTGAATKGTMARGPMA
jgi:hypothetical protein